VVVPQRRTDALFSRFSRPDEHLAPQRWLGSLGRPTPRPLKHSHLKKHTAVARATAGKVLASRCASQGQSTRRGLSCQAWYAFTTTRPHRVTEALAELPGGTRQWRAQPWSCMDAAPGCRLQRRPSANILLTAWPGRVAQAPRAGRARAPWSCSKPCWRPSSRTARFRDQLQLGDEANSIIADGGVTWAHCRRVVPRLVHLKRRQNDRLSITRDEGSRRRRALGV